ncbi:uncharacterized protein LOC119094908 [Pollicipes pollicipes]|uniref:uncharacterized protein LOC119094908 n=1 Tax=Pollicipes pollicipes TaxID=41117 RepID=UPI0018858ED7|nr:uncharacterized protein LOC119094908 [Pollicipes pollicipes]
MACNRTYYGFEGRTYGLELRPPRRQRLPHVCQLTFIADGGEHGDLLELVFDTFSLGRFTSHVHNGCPDGHMQIAEVGRIHNDGFWCGSGWGYNVYYSETSTVTVTFRLYRLSGGGSFSGDEVSQFYVKLRYKFISAQRAVMRSGPKQAKFRGIPVYNSFCDFMFDNCDRVRCRIQSPNFPGLYPRNVTCSYHIKHSEPPGGTRALLVLSQRYGELINVKDTDSAGGAVRQLHTWAKCDLVRDFVTVYDGMTKSAPKLLKFCGGGALPPLVSSGPNMIVEFRTSAFDRLSQPALSRDKLKHPTSYIPGFELDVSVRFVNISERTRFVDRSGCRYVFTSTISPVGLIGSPAHSLPSNTSCTYTLLGRSHERLWLYFLQYHVTYHASHQEGYGHDAKSRHCHHRLDIIDGAPGGGRNRSLGFFCGDTKPLLCTRALRAAGGAAVPPCALHESYLSSSENVTLTQRHVTGLGLDTASFQLRYEFVDMREDGQQLGDEPCHRVFASRGRLSKGSFGPAKNVFLYGRGGRTHLRCLFRFEGTAGERVRILVNKFTAADESGCETVRDERLQRYRCRYHGGARSELRLAEVPWPGVRVWRDCVCADRTTGTPIVVESTASVLELRYDVFNMTAAEDFYSYSFIAKYEFLRKTACKTETRINGSSGAMNLERREESEGRCDALPWMLEASPSAYLYLSVPGRREAPGVCQAATRLVVSAPDLPEPLAVICPACNRTYYGFEGRTYGLELRPPRRQRLPHVCQLTFIADGGEHGDLLELVFDTFSLGRFTSHVHNGCPDGHMQIAEVGRIHNDGFWCGSGWGYNVYYSETSTVTVTFRLYRLSGGGSFSGDEVSQFYVKLRYKFISAQRAVMRSGPKQAKFRGIPVYNSFCDFMFDNCDRVRCRIQSPNFPGLYPRNVTCSYHIKHSEPPGGTRALLVLSQRYGELINVKDTDSAGGAVRQLHTWAKCDLVRDFVTVYDGMTKSAPKLLKFCGGGALPPLVSSGPNMIVEFRTSAFDRLSQPALSRDKLKHPTSYIPGFELDVSVRFVNISERTRFVDRSGCRYVFTSTISPVGLIGSPAHSLPSNTSCTYTLLGRSHERLWLYFLQYHVTYHASHQEGYGHDAKSRHCHHRLDIIDGAPGGGRNRSLGFFCGDTKPLLCTRALRAAGGAAVPPCALHESYLSSSENVTLTQRHVTGLGLDTASFQLRYEFVDMREDGQQLGDEPKGSFGPAKNVFLYGRGGRTHLRCLFRFEGTAGERVRILVNKFTAADESGCETVRDERLQRYRCRYHGGARSELRLAEVPWPGVRVWRDCVCADRTTGTPIVVESTASVLELRYDVFNMTAAEDFYSYSFIAKYEFLRKTACKTETRINGSSGAMNLERREESEGRCDALPWMLEASPSAYLYLSVPGRREAPGVCQAATRLVVSAPDLPEPLAVICPGGGDMVEVFSAGWRRGERAEPLGQHQRHLVLDVVSAVPGQPVKVSWLELVRPEVQRSSQVAVVDAGHWTEAWSAEPCRHMCPELAGGCIAPHLWCDSVHHCPSGRDEDPAICHRWSIPWLYVGVGASALFIIVILCVAAIVHRKQKRPPATGAAVGAIAHDPHEKRLPTDETLASGNLYSGSSSLKNGKDLISAPSTYSMDSVDVDLVETTV